MLAVVFAAAAGAPLEKRRMLLPDGNDPNPVVGGYHTHQMTGMGSKLDYRELRPGTFLKADLHMLAELLAPLVVSVVCIFITFTTTSTALAVAAGGPAEDHSSSSSFAVLCLDIFPSIGAFAIAAVAFVTTATATAVAGRTRGKHGRFCVGYATLVLFLHRHPHSFFGKGCGRCRRLCA